MSIRPITRGATALLLLGFAFGACAQSAKDTLVANAADSMFMTHAAADGMAEITMGQMALEKSSNTEVKQLAQRIVDDHTDANAKLRSLAQAKQVTLPTGPTDEARQSADAMASMDPTKFDQAWTAAMVKDHQKAVALFAREVKQTRDPEVRTFAEATLPTLKAHLELAQQLDDKMDMPAARDQAMNHGAAMDASFAHADPAGAASAAASTSPVPGNDRAVEK